MNEQQLLSENTASTPRPFIIWTLQRTGGTNFAQRLVKRSPLDGVQHEPFNIGRVFGHVSDQWKQNRDEGALEQAIREICDSGLIIKHCVEMVPWEVSRQLTITSSAAGYRHLFLYRQNPVERLLSMHFATMSGIWGPELRDQHVLDDKIFTEPLPVSDLVAHEMRCAKLLTNTWRYIKVQGDQPLAISYEELYQADDKNRQEGKVLGVLAYLGLAIGEAADQQFVSELTSTGDQGTRSKYAAFKGIDDLQSGVNAVDLFQPEVNQLSVTVNESYQEVRGIVHAEIDYIPDWVQTGEGYFAAGVVVIDKPDPKFGGLHLISDAGVVEVEWGINSPWIAQQYPSALNRQTARFRIVNLIAKPGMNYRLCIAEASGEMTELFRIQANG